MSARKELFEIKSPGLARDEEDLPAVQADTAPSGQVPGTLPPGTIIFSVEQLTLLAVAVLTLVVVAFLVGSYVSGGLERSPAVGVPEVKVVEAAERLLPDEHGEPPLPQVYEKPPEKPAEDKPVSTPEGKYTLQVIRFSLEDRAVAVATVERLQKYGYAPVFIETHGGELSVCVGRFDDRKDKKALMWRDELRNLHSAYRHCDFVAVKSKG